MNHYADVREALTPKEPARQLKKATRKPKTARVARTRAGNTWSEAQFWNFLRSGLRQLSRRWPPLVRLIWLEHRRPYVGPNKRQRFEHQCSACKGWFIRRSMAADHIEACGSLRSWAEFAQFGKRLFVETPKIRLLCEQCHKVRHDGESDLPS